MPRKSIYELNYCRLIKLLGRPLQAIRAEEVYRFQAPGFMDLVVERISPCSETGVPVLSLAHYFEQHGDLCADPEMTVRVFEPKANRPEGLVEALTFHQAIPPLYQEVYPAPGKFSPRLKRDLNGFLVTWLRNLLDQGHKLAE